MRSAKKRDYMETLQKNNRGQKKASRDTRRLCLDAQRPASFWGCHEVKDVLGSSRNDLYTSCVRSQQGDNLLSYKERRVAQGAIGGYIVL